MPLVSARMSDNAINASSLSLLLPALAREAPPFLLHSLGESQYSLSTASASASTHYGRREAAMGVSEREKSMLGGCS